MGENVRKLTGDGVRKFGRTLLEKGGYPFSDICRTTTGA